MIDFCLCYYSSEERLGRTWHLLRAVAFPTGFVADGLLRFLDKVLLPATHLGKFLDFETQAPKKIWAGTELYRYGGGVWVAPANLYLHTVADWCIAGQLGPSWDDLRPKSPLLAYAEELPQAVPVSEKPYADTVPAGQTRFLPPEGDWESSWETVSSGWSGTGPDDCSVWPHLLWVYEGLTGPFPGNPFPHITNGQTYSDHEWTATLYDGSSGTYCILFLAGQCCDMRLMQDDNWQDLSTYSTMVDGFLVEHAWMNAGKHCKVLRYAPRYTSPPVVVVVGDYVEEPGSGPASTATGFGMFALLLGGALAKVAVVSSAGGRREFVAIETEAGSAITDDQGREVLKYE